MTRLPIILLCMLVAGGTASAATVSGSSALALASLVAANSRLLAQQDRSVLARMLAGYLNFRFPPDRKIAVEADSIVCRASNVDITSRSCELTFGPKKVTLSGRKAHELFATLAEVGVRPDGAAGTIRESLSRLSCTIDPNEVKQKAGGGATCNFDPGKP
ncbi:MAG: hypothetical protein U1E81_10700 [Xanthobacteraceae bacterium]